MSKYYKVSNINERYLCYYDGRIFDTLRGKFLIKTINKTTGYESVWFYVNRNTKKYLYVHHIIYFAFHNIKYLPKGYNIDHINNNRNDNKINNLKLVSQRDNIIKSKIKNIKQYREIDHKHYLKQKQNRLLKKELIIFNNIYYF